METDPIQEISSLPAPDESSEDMESVEESLYEPLSYEEWSSLLEKRAELEGGVLYLVATPIGNLEDITLRALRVLRDCHWIAAEDTRKTGSLLSRFGIKKRMVSYHQFNEARRAETILTALENQEIVALVTDAGSPAVSDPGERIVREAIQRGLRVEAVPGACALIVGLSISGLPMEGFSFLGFPPRKSGGRRRFFEEALELKNTWAIYESPYRVLKSLQEINDLAPDRPVVLARELTKKFEEVIRGSASEVTSKFDNRKLKGECMIMVGPKPE